MAEIVRLKHTTRKNNWIFFHYKGHAPVKNGVLELPADNTTLIRRAYVMGFRLNEDGQPISANRLSEIVAKATVTDSSEEQQSEDSNNGRQSGTTDRVRESQSESSRNPAKSGSSSRVSSGARRQAKRPDPNTGSRTEVPTA
jgi:hypothetical protein